MPAFALKRHSEVTMGREVFQECYGKFTLHFAEHVVPNVEVTRWYEEEPGVPLDFGRPRENIGLRHAEQPSVWCVVRAGYEITVAYDSKKNIVTFLNMQGMFSLRNVCPELAQWAREAERVLPFTGAVHMRHICNAYYAPQDHKELLVERHDVLPPEEDGAHGNRDAGGHFDLIDRGAYAPSSNKQAVSGKSSAPAASEQHKMHAITGREPVAVATRNPVGSSRESAGESAGFRAFHLAEAMMSSEAQWDGETWTELNDGRGNKQILELQLHGTKICLVKVPLLLLFCACFCAAPNFNLHQYWRDFPENCAVKEMSVSKPVLKRADSNTVHISLARDTAIYCKRGTRYETNIYGALHSIAATFKGESTCFSLRGFVLTLRASDAAESGTFMQVVEDRRKTTELSQIFELEPSVIDDSQRTQVACLVACTVCSTVTVHHASRDACSG